MVTKIVRYFSGSGILVSPTLLVTCAHVVEEKQIQPDDVTRVHFKRDAIRVNGIDVDVVAAGNSQSSNDPDLAFLHLRSPLTLPPVPLVQTPLDQIRVRFPSNLITISPCSQS